jgi:hypothetical protein
MEALTRYSQTLDNPTWVEYDALAGDWSYVTQDRWHRFIGAARLLDRKEVEKMLGHHPVHQEVA